MRTYLESKTGVGSVSGYTGEIPVEFGLLSYENGLLSSVTIGGLHITFIDFMSANALVGDASNVMYWNTFLNPEIPFTKVYVLGSSVVLLGGYVGVLADNAFEEVYSLVKIEDNEGSINSAGDYCFSQCQNLITVNLPSLISAGDNCFQSCLNLRYINLPSVKTVGDYCFHITGLVTVLLPNLESLGIDRYFGNVFYQSFNIGNLTIPAALMTCNNGEPDGDIQYLMEIAPVTITQV